MLSYKKGSRQRLYPILRPSGPKPVLGLQIMHNGVSKAYYDIKLDDGGKATVEIPSDQLPTGVNQFTLFDEKRTCIRRPPDIRQPSRI